MCYFNLETHSYCGHQGHHIEPLDYLRPHPKSVCWIETTESMTGQTIWVARGLNCPHPDSKVRYMGVWPSLCTSCVKFWRDAHELAQGLPRRENRLPPMLPEYGDHGVIKHTLPSLSDSISQDLLASVESEISRSEDYRGGGSRPRYGMKNSMDLETVRQLAVLANENLGTLDPALLVSEEEEESVDDKGKGKSAGSDSGKREKRRRGSRN